MRSCAQLLTAAAALAALSCLDREGVPGADGALPVGLALAPTTATPAEP
jgi:hypothetical protein